MENKEKQNQDKIGLFLELIAEGNNKLKLDIKNYLTKEDIDFITDILIETKINDHSEETNQENEVIDEVIEIMAYFVVSYRNKLRKLKEIIDNSKTEQ